MLIISYDAVGDSEFEHLTEYPAFSAFAEQSAVYRGVPSLFLSNTYPIHTSVVTGVPPGVHGVITNTAPSPSPHPAWNNGESAIRVQTLWQAAARRGVKTAAVFWPVTARSGTIRYNIPEVIAPPGKNQLVTSLKAGSKLLQLMLFIKHHKQLAGIRQPAIDQFATSCMADILRKYKPGLALIHLTAYDMLCHEEGKGGAAIKAAFESLDRSLAVLLDAAGEDRDVILFSDHGQFDVHTVVDPNGLLAEAGLINMIDGAYITGEHGCFVDCCGGSAFFCRGDLNDEQVGVIRAAVERGEGFRRFLTPEEMEESGWAGSGVPFGFCAKTGYCYGIPGAAYRANHGYPLDMPDYKVFYMARGRGIKPGCETGGSLLDITPFAAGRLGITL